MVKQIMLLPWMPIVREGTKVASKLFIHIIKCFTQTPKQT